MDEEFKKKDRERKQKNRKDNPEVFKQYARTYYEKHREKISQKAREPENARRKLASNRMWRKNNRDKCRGYNLKSNYGISEIEWNVLFESQNKCCAICEGTQPGGYHNQWNTDHIHGTKTIRGILCHSCNTTLHATDTPELLRKKADYLEKYLS